MIIRKSGVLEFITSIEGFNGVGGLGTLKRWVRLRNEVFTQRARDFGLHYPEGALIVGVSGCGKSLCAKALASEWKKPLLRFDLGRVCTSHWGESVERMRKALSIAERIAPAILWIDELEKGLSGIGGSGESGVNLRVFGAFLTWMAEKEKPVFVVMTANDISRLPPELFCKGRMDEIFFVDLPNPVERAEILMIHLAKRQRDPQDFDLPALVRATDGFNGAELEEVIVSGLYDAFSEKREDNEPRLMSRHLLKAASETIPLAQSRQLEIDRLRQWAEKNCRMAAGRQEEGKEAESTPESLVERQARILDLGEKGVGNIV